MKHLLLFYSCLLFLAPYVGAQDKRTCADYDFSPQAFAMLTNENVHLDLNTGTLNVSIPVYDWKDEDFMLPLRMTYSTNGFKPARPTGIVGLDWSLQLGGVISRQIVGIDDLKTCGYYYKPNIYTSDQMYDLQPDFAYNENYGTTMVGQHETNPDVFHFSFLGHSGSFILNPMGDFMVYESSGDRGCYEIDVLVSASSGTSFLITTSDGYKYYFGSDEVSREKLYSVNSVCFTTGAHGNRPINYDERSTISWYLSKVVAPNGRELIFNYSSNSSFQGVPLATDDVCTTFGQGFVTFKNTLGNDIQTHKHPSITTVSYLSSIDIKTPDSQITEQILKLDYSDKAYIEKDSGDKYIYYGLMTRQKKLDRVTFYNHSGEKLCELSLSYLYKNTRMLLSRLWISNIGTYDFSYNLDNPMPGILTNAIDFWGFYNGRTDNSDTAFLPSEVDLLYDEYIVEDYKNPDSVFSASGTLKSITYPTGGHSEFEYEANTASQILLRRRTAYSINHFALPPTEIDTTSYIDKESFSRVFLPSLRYYNDELGLQECGGVRIRSIADYSDTTCLSRRTYSYNVPGTDESSGIVLKFNRYFSSSVLGVNVYDPSMKFPDMSLDKHHVAYTYVTEHMADGSYTIHKYTDYHQYPDEFSPKYKQDSWPLGHTGNYAYYINNILREPDSRHYRRGLIESIENYSNDDELVFRKECIYEDSDSSFVAYIVGSGDYWWSARRFTCDFLLVGTKETHYMNGNISTKRVFNYNSAGQKAYEATMDNEEKNGSVTYYRYCYENPTLTGPNSLKMVPSDIIHVKIRNGNEYVIGNYELSYDAEASHTNPVEIKEYCISKPISFNSGNTALNDLVAIGRSSPSLSTCYEYNEQDRLTRISNPGNAYMALEWDEEMNHVVRKEVNASSNCFTYQWTDMVGLKRITEPSGQAEIYEYDSKNRLKAIKTQTGKLVQEYLYHLNRE